LDFKNLPQPQNSKELNQRFYNSQEIDLELSKELDSLGSQEIDLVDNFNEELTIQDTPQEESSTQAQIQIPPKNNL